LVLQAEDTWPRTATVFCHRPGEWPSRPAMIDQAPVRSCQRRGVTIDLVLDRPRENSSQLVFTSLDGGREAILWQPSRALVHAPAGPPAPPRWVEGRGHAVILVGNREGRPYRFPRKAAWSERRALPVGDYGVEAGGEIFAVVERKSLAELAGRLFDGSLASTMAELATMSRAAVVVEDRYGEIFKLNHVTAGFMPDLLAEVQVRYPSVPIVFCDTRPLAARWTYRFLVAAFALAQAEIEEIEIDLRFMNDD